VTVLDLISFSNRRYHGSAETLSSLRHHVRRYLERADAVTTISADVAAHVLAEVPALDPARVSVTPLGVEHLTHQRPHSDVPAGLERLVTDQGVVPFLLVLGNDFMHKNRDFAVRVWQQTSADTRLDLVLAGLNVGPGSGEPFERPLRAWTPPNGSRLHLLESVPTNAKVWLLSNARVVLYPTAAEGFGFVPFEAATMGTPTVFTRFGPLAENMPAGVGVIGWQVASYVDAVRRLLASPEDSSAWVDQIAGAAAELTWDRCAAALIQAFRQALEQPARVDAVDGEDAECRLCAEAGRED
jgi:glycosyltransferase involved in cell wall biosynthesis